MHAPLIVTAWVRDEDIDVFNRLRARFFPRSRNFLSAHVTLFHHLPGGARDEVYATVGDAVTRFGGSLPDRTPPTAAIERQPVLPVDVRHVFNMGRGVAYALAPDDLAALRAPIARHFGARLTEQDARPWRNPHITVQNKVSPAAAAQLARHLGRRFSPCAIGVCGLQVWRYERGPWTHLASFGFGQAPIYEPGYAPVAPSIFSAPADRNTPRKSAVADVDLPDQRE